MLESTTEAARPIDLNRLNAVEKQMGVEFPEGYRRFLLAYNGGQPNPADFTAVEAGETVWMRIHCFHGVDDDVEGCDLLWNFRILKGRLPDNVISIASDEVGNDFCLDLRQQGRGRVLFWNHELEAAGPDVALQVCVANSFEEWLDQLTAHA